MRARDTSPEAHAVQLRVYARMGSQRRVELAFEMSEQAREMAIDGVRERNPGWSRQQAREFVLRQILGAALFDSAWPGSRPASS
jgi:hypothetical protein